MTESDLSAEGDAQTPLPAPTGLEVVDVRDDEADVRFQDHADNKEGYRAYVGEDGYLSSDGEDQYTTMGQTQSLRTAGDSALYAEISGLTEGSHQYIFGNEWNYEGGAIVIDNGNVLYRFGDGGSATDVVSSVDVTDEERHTIWGWYDSASETGYISVDRETPNEATGVRVEQSTSIDFVVAAGKSGKQKYLNANVHRAGAFSRIPDKQEREITRQGAKPTGGMGWYEFNQGSGDTLTDYSGNGNHGTLYNDPTWVGGGGLTQNGRDITPDYSQRWTANGQFGDGPDSLGIGGETTSLTVMFSFRGRQEDVGDWGGAISFGGLFGGAVFGGIDDIGAFDPTLGDDEGNHYRCGDAEYPYDEPSLFAMTYDYDAGVMRNWVNAINKQTNSDVGQITLATDSDVSLSSGGIAGWWKGDLGQIWVYDRALSQSEQEATMRGNYPTDGLRYNWNFDDRTESIVPDETGNTGGIDVTNGSEYAPPVFPIRHTLTGLENGEAYVTRASVFTDHEEVFDS